MPSKQVLIGLAAIYVFLAGAFYYLGSTVADDALAENVGEGSKMASQSSQPGSRSSAKKGTRSFRLDDLKPTTHDLEELDALSLNSLMSEMVAAFDVGVQDQAAVGRVWNMIQLLGDKDMDAALEYAANVPPPKGQFIALLLLPRLGTFRGAEAMDAVKEAIPGGQMQSMGNMMVLMSWSESKPVDAFDWFLEKKRNGESNSVLHGSMFRGMIMGGLITNLAREDVGAAFDRIGQLENQQLEQEALTSLAQLGAQSDIRDRLITEFSAIENSEARGAALSQLAQSWAASEPRAALDWALSIENETERDSASDTARETWIQNDPATAAAELLEITDPEDRGDFFIDVAGNWVQQEPEAALTWLSANAEGKARDDALSRGAEAIVYTSPEAALRWARGIESEESRTMTATTAYDVIAQQSGRPAAEAALRRNGFSDEALQSVIAASAEAEAQERLNTIPSLSGDEFETDGLENDEPEPPDQP